MNIRKLIRVVAPHFVAGVETKNGKCVKTAPILRWTRGMTEREMFAAFKQKGWTATIISSGDGINWETV